MTEKKITKIAVIALIFALVALSQTSAVLNIFNYTFHAGSNINIVDDGLGNVTISAMGGTGTDNTKVNKSYDTVSNTFFLKSIDDYNYFIFNPLYQDLFYSNYNGDYGVSEIKLEKTKLSIINDQQYTYAGIEINNGSIDITADNVSISSDVNFTGNKIINADLNNSVDKNLANYTNTYNWVNNSTMAPDNTKLNVNGGISTGKQYFLDADFNNSDNRRINMSYNNKVVGSYDAWDYGSGLSFSFFSSNRFQSKLNGWQSLSYPERPGATIIWQNDAYSYYTFDSNSNVPVGVFTFDSTGLLISPGKNITISSLSGSGNKPACFDANGKLFRSTTSTC